MELTRHKICYTGNMQTVQNCSLPHISQFKIKQLKAKWDGQTSSDTTLSD